MPKRSDINKVLVIGSGPIVIGQAAEFDYAGAQACRVLKAAGVNVVLCNSNPATIMTDKALADEIYLEPLTLESIKRINSMRELSIEDSFHFIDVLLTDNCFIWERYSFCICLEWNTIRKECCRDKYICINQNLHSFTSSFLISATRLTMSSSFTNPAFWASPAISCCSTCIA